MFEQEAVLGALEGTGVVVLRAGPVLANIRSRVAGPGCACASGLWLFKAKVMASVAVYNALQGRIDAPLERLRLHCIATSDAMGGLRIAGLCKAAPEGTGGRRSAGSCTRCRPRRWRRERVVGRWSGTGETVGMLQKNQGLVSLLLARARANGGMSTEQRLAARASRRSGEAPRCDLANDGAASMSRRVGAGCDAGRGRGTGKHVARQL